jgi:hypothetical protein
MVMMIMATLITNSEAVKSLGRTMLNKNVLERVIKAIGNETKGKSA